MLRIIKNKKAQAVSAEYVIALSIIVGMMSAMSIYVKRAIQARIRDARYEMANIVKDRVAGRVKGNIWRAYEPYYLNIKSNVTRTTLKVQKLGGATATFETGTYVKKIEEATVLKRVSITAPPNEAD